MARQTRSSPRLTPEPPEDDDAAMDVRAIRWIGIATDRADEMRWFLHDVLGLEPRFDEPTTAEFATSDGDAVQIMGPGDPYHGFFGTHALGPVPLFEVDDVERARAELVAAGVEIVGEPGSDTQWSWIHVRAPDGNLYEFASRR
jgi:catechol 2,3-dioxygenase-like lactoylglutathione lyase family enzyme